LRHGNERKSVHQLCHPAIAALETRATIGVQHAIAVHSL
jgi:hypothetical protein